VRRFHEHYDTDDVDAEPDSPESPPSPVPLTRQRSAVTGLGRRKKLTISSFVIAPDHGPIYEPGATEPGSGILKNPKKADHEIKFRIREIINYYFMHPDYDHAISSLIHLVQDSLFPRSEMVHQVLAFIIANKRESQIDEICEILLQMYVR
jgi:hypothetical protein